MLDEDRAMLCLLVLHFLKFGKRRAYFLPSNTFIADSEERGKK